LLLWSRRFDAEFTHDQQQKNIQASHLLLAAVVLILALPRNVQSTKTVNTIVEYTYVLP
jgi:hypothetical protein